MGDDAADGLLGFLEQLPQRRQRQWCLALVLSGVAHGLQLLSRGGELASGLVFRDHEQRNPFGIDLQAGALVFTIRRPALEQRPALALDAAEQFGESARGATSGSSEVSISVRDASDAETIAHWLFPAISRGYAARISA